MGREVEEEGSAKKRRVGEEGEGRAVRGEESEGEEVSLGEEDEDVSDDGSEGGSEEGSEEEGSDGELAMVDFEKETLAVLGETGLSVRERQEQLAVLIELAMDAVEPGGCWEALMGMAETLADKSPQNPEVAEDLAAAMREVLEPRVELGSRAGARGAQGSGGEAEVGAEEEEAEPLRGVEEELLEEEWAVKLDAIHAEFKPWGFEDFGALAARMRELIGEANRAKGPA